MLDQGEALLPDQRVIELVGFVAPHSPVVARLPAEHFEVRAVDQPLDPLIGFVRLPAVLPARRDDQAADVLAVLLTLRVPDGMQEAPLDLGLVVAQIGFQSMFRVGAGRS